MKKRIILLFITFTAAVFSNATTQAQRVIRATGGYLIIDANSIPGWRASTGPEDTGGGATKFRLAAADYSGARVNWATAVSNCNSYTEAGATTNH